MRSTVVTVLASIAAALSTQALVACSSSDASTGEIGDAATSPEADVTARACELPPIVLTLTTAEACALIEGKPSPVTRTMTMTASSVDCTFDAAFTKLLPSLGAWPLPPAGDAGAGERDADTDGGGDAGGNGGASGFVCPTHDAAVTLTCADRRPCGRPYEGYVSVPTGPSARAYLASCMDMEAASVAAFRVLEHELRALGAPEALLAACRDAASDEVRHAEQMGELVGEVPAIPVVAPRRRSALEIALENARVGMVRETYGAVVAKVQGTMAKSATIRDVWSAIGDDEIGHAGLAWEIGAFLSTCLDARERATVSAALRDEVTALAAELSGLPPHGHREVGVPGPETARTIVAQLRSHLWDRAALAA